MENITVVVPCYNEEQVLELFYHEITKVADSMASKYGVGFSFLFIDDGSKDKTLAGLKSLAEKDKRVEYVSFSRNFGKEAGMYAGLENADGDFVVIMDADLQDPPELIEEMYTTIKTGTYDCVGTRRVTRKGEPPIRSFFARTFYKLMGKISKTEVVDGARDYRMMTRQMVDSILSMQEYNRFSKGIFSWVGFETKWLEYENVERAAGETKWSFGKLLIYSLDGIVAFSTVPLSIASIMGILFCFIAVIWIAVVIIKTLIWGDPVGGYPSLICVIFFIGGTQLLCLGILGQYLSKTYLETKRRPIYIAREVHKGSAGPAADK